MIFDTGNLLAQLSDHADLIDIQISLIFIRLFLIINLRWLGLSEESLLEGNLGVDKGRGLQLNVRKERMREGLIQSHSVGGLELEETFEEGEAGLRLYA
jgi:hypothetical protein